MESNFLGSIKRHWKEIAIIASLLFVSAGFAIGLSLSKKPSNTAIIKHHSETLYSINLKEENEERSFFVDGDHGKVEISVRKDEIKVSESNCPSQFCVHKGWVKGGEPIICAYNGISITFMEDSGSTAILG